MKKIKAFLTQPRKTFFTEETLPLWESVLTDFAITLAATALFLGFILCALGIFGIID